MSNRDIATIIVPVDGSGNAGRAVDYAAMLTKKTGAQLVLLHAFPKSPTELIGLMGYPGVPGDVVHLSEEDVERAVEASAKAAFSAAREALGSDVTASDEVVRGAPAQAIMDYAAKQKDALIVMGTRGLSPMKELLLGSISEKVMRHAPCPVTLVR
jgi:nucleotide-binding universal stress UspA family protein